MDDTVIALSVLIFNVNIAVTTFEQLKSAIRTKRHLIESWELETDVIRIASTRLKRSSSSKGKVDILIMTFANPYTL